MENNFKRHDGRGVKELRPIEAKVGVVPNADGSAMFSFGDTIAIVAVYGPKEMQPKHKQDPRKGTLKCDYSMMSFSVHDRIRPGRNRRSTEVSKITEWALEPVLMLKEFPNQIIEVYINILQADASTRCAGINAASMALAQAGIPMTGLISSVSIGKLDRQLVADLDKTEEDFEEGEGATDIPISMTQEGDITHMQIDGKIRGEELKEAILLAKEKSKEIYKIQKKALEESFNDE